MITRVDPSKPHLISGHRLQKLQVFFTGNIRVSKGLMKPQEIPNTMEPDKHP